MPQAGLNYRQRRDKLRLPLDRRVQLKSPSLGELELQGLDYSPSGIAVSSHLPLTVGEQVMLRFAVGRNRETELEVCGEVVHHWPDSESHVIGICFLEQVAEAPGWASA